MIKVGLVGLGFMGQMHLGCYRRNPLAEVVAVCDENPEALSGEGAVAGNIGGNEPLDLSGIHTTTRLEELLQNPEIDLVDFCLPTRQHASATIRALEAGKHVLCEKPMAFTLEECDAMIEAQERSGKTLMIGHCLRFWPQYVKAGELLQSGALGRPLYASFHRESGAPIWSRWMMDGAQSGGVTLDMHIHDVDTALWWFGAPREVNASGVTRDGLPLKVDATWRYDNGLLVQLHGGWDTASLPFRMAFEVMCEGGTVTWDSSRGESLSVFRGADEEQFPCEGDGYSGEINYLLSCLDNGETPTRATPQTSRQSVSLAREELRQMSE